MTDDEAAQKLIEFDKLGDPETSHYKADDILCELLLELGYKNTVNAFNDMYKWYA